MRIWGNIWHIVYLKLHSWYIITMFVSFCFSLNCRIVFERRKPEWSSIAFINKIVFWTFQRNGKVSPTYSMWTIWCIRMSSIQTYFKINCGETEIEEAKISYFDLWLGLSVHIRSDSLSLAILEPTRMHSNRVCTVCCSGQRSRDGGLSRRVSAQWEGCLPGGGGGVCPGGV